LVLLTDTEGFYEVDPRLNPKAKIISDIKKWDEEYFKRATSSKTLVGTGGMTTKMKAAKNMMRSGIPMAIVNGNAKNILARLLKGEGVGSYFYPTAKRMSSRDRWLTWSVKPKGEVTIDDGAQKALFEKNKSLLPSGILEVFGNWVSGDVVKIIDISRKELARGISNYSSQELERIKGFRTEEVFKTLGYQVRDEVVHRDNMVKMGEQ
jgi:glutamate 5-kinase